MNFGFKSKVIPGLKGAYHTFVHSKTTGGILLLICAAVAVMSANIPSMRGLYELWHMEVGFSFGEFSFKMPLEMWINDVLMTIFFFSVGLEIKRELLVGELSSPKKALLPIFAALGGMLVPAAIYAFINGGTPSANGWGIPMATDIAFAIGILSLLGNRCPLSLKVFLTALAIVDDIGAIIVLAVFYPSHALHLNYLIFAAVIILILLIINRSGVKSAAAYLIPGFFLFLCVFQSGIHATIAGVILAMTIPATTSINEVRFYVGTKSLLEKFKDAGNSEVQVLANSEQLDYIYRISQSVKTMNPLLHRLESKLHPWVNFFIMPVFALANAGVEINGEVISSGVVPPVMQGIFFGLLLGKPIGITLFSYIAVKLKLAQAPKGALWRQVFALGIVGGIGFTMSIFIDNLAFQDKMLIDEGKLAILVTSVCAAIIGLLALFLTTRATNTDEKQ
ncbi:MAG: Na+/H+ antiporter NhaA [Bacteroidales bacterium]|nr:Na+/H+ antiporter NhaA [Bacteroidales bacterium]MBO7284034.1 Na+/H+ antiporter NhaA [Bacteroidales bacterium]MBO7322445.1 Na+/H+ antiporter NhaA [Bacteroidales bacterium]